MMRTLAARPLRWQRSRLVAMATLCTCRTTTSLENHYFHAITSMQEGRPLRAAVHLRRQLQSHPTAEAVSALNAVGEDLMDAGELGTAEACWQASLTADAAQPEVHERLADHLRLTPCLAPLFFFS